MNSFIYVELDLFAIILLIFMLVGQNGRESRSLEQRLFNFVLSSTSLALLFDAIQWLLDGRTFAGARLAGMAAGYLYYVMNAIVPFSWLIYCDLKTNGSLHELRRRIFYYVIPFGLSIGLIIANIWTGWVFAFDAANWYHRGPYFAIASAIIFSQAIWAALLAFVRAIRATTETDRMEFRLLSRFMILPTIGYIVQTLVYGLPLIWVGTTISLFLIFMKVQNRLIYTDELTKVYNRRQLPREFVRRVETADAARHVYAVVIDADDFKKINDTFGHASGDAMLVRAAKLLERVCARRGDFLARTGGDEFLILATRGAGEGFSLVEEVEAATRKLNSADTSAGVLALSCGVAAFGERGIDSLDRLLSEADRRMFANKAARKADLRKSAS